MSTGKALFFADLRSTRRDPTFGFLLLSPLLIGVMLRLLIPVAADILLERTGFSLGTHIPALVAFFLQLPPLLAGMMIGLLFIEERDGGLLESYAVSPLGRDGFLRYRLLETGVLSFFFTLITLVLLLPLLAGAPLTAGDCFALFCALLPGVFAGPMVTAFLVLFARDKVAGLVLAKLISFPIMLPAVWYLLPGGGPVLLNILYPVPAFRAWTAAFASSGIVKPLLMAAAALLLEGLLLSLLVRSLRRAKKLPRAFHLFFSG